MTSHKCPAQYSSSWMSILSTVLIDIVQESQWLEPHTVFRNKYNNIYWKNPKSRLKNMQKSPPNTFQIPTFSNDLSLL